MTEIKISKIEVAEYKYDVDKICMFVSGHKEAEYPYRQYLRVHFNAAQGTGAKYCKKNFPGVEIDVRKEKD